VKRRVISVETKEPVPGTWAMINGSGYTAVADTAGFFRILLPDSLAGKPIRFHTLHPNYGRPRLTVSSNDFPALLEMPPPPPSRRFPPVA
jgi:hypothetical protein